MGKKEKKLEKAVEDKKEKKETAVCYKKIEVVGTSKRSFSDAVQNAVVKASESLHNIKWFEVVESRGRVSEGKIAEFQVTVSIGFEID